MLTPTKFALIALIPFFSLSLLAQNLKSEKIEYTYIQLPMEPLAKDIKNYQSFVIASYEKANQEKMAKYEAEVAAAEAEYQAAMAEYPSKVKAAEEKYEKELAAWDEKSLTEKVVEKNLLNENNKPVKQVPSQPYRRSVAQPKLQTSYDYKALAGTYLVLDGYLNTAENAVKIEVSLNGYDYTKPRQLTEEKNVVTTTNGTSTTKKVTYYYVEYSYRHTMSVRVSLPDGTELFNLTPQELNNYTTYKSNQTTTSQSINEEQLVKLTEEKILQTNLSFIYNLVNDRIGFKKTARSCELAYVKDKNGVYEDLTLAFNEASSGLKLLVDDSKTATEKLDAAAKLWSDALTESNLVDKKARIDKDVTLAIYFNLLELYFASGDVDNAKSIMDKMSTLSLSNQERIVKENYMTLITDLNKRIQANS